MTRRKVPRVVSRVIEVDGEWFLIGRRDDEGFEAVRLVGKDRYTVMGMQNEHQIEVEAALLRHR